MSVCSRKDYSIVDAEGNSIGRVTSGTMAPSVKKAIGLGYVAKEFSAEGSDIFLDIRNKKVAAKVVKLPFFKA